VIREGRNREVRRMWESQGLLVSRLKRIRYGNVELPRGLKRSQHQPLDAEEIRKLRECAGAPKPAPRLTLTAVVGQRRAAPTEFRPQTASQQAWTGARHDEAREFAAFDRIRDDGWRSPAARPGAKRRRGGANPAPPGGRRKAAPQRGKRGTQAATRYVEPGLNPAVLRSWFPETAAAPSGRRNRKNRPAAGGPMTGNYAQQAPARTPVDGNRAEPSRQRREHGNASRAGDSQQRGTPAPRGRRNRHRGPRPPR
jgi:23S rRNA pseudouridine2605 synthase